MLAHRKERPQSHYLVQEAAESSEFMLCHGDPRP